MWRVPAATASLQLCVETLPFLVRFRGRLMPFPCGFNDGAAFGREAGGKGGGQDEAGGTERQAETADAEPKKRSGRRGERGGRGGAVVEGPGRARCGDGPTGAFGHERCPTVAAAARCCCCSLLLLLLPPPPPPQLATSCCCSLLLAAAHVAAAHVAAAAAAPPPPRSCCSSRIHSLPHHSLTHTPPLPNAQLLEATINGSASPSPAEGASPYRCVCTTSHANAMGLITSDRGKSSELVMKWL